MTFSRSSSSITYTRCRRPRAPIYTATSPAGMRRFSVDRDTLGSRQASALVSSLMCSPLIVSLRLIYGSILMCHTCQRLFRCCRRRRFLCLGNPDFCNEMHAGGLLGSDRVETVKIYCHSLLFVASLQETPGAALPEKLHLDQSPQLQPFPGLRGGQQPRVSQDAVSGDGLQVGAGEGSVIDVAGCVLEGVLVFAGLEHEEHQGQFPAVVPAGVAAAETTPVVLQPCAYPPERGGPALAQRLLLRQNRSVGVGSIPNLSLLKRTWEIRSGVRLQCQHREMSSGMALLGVAERNSS